MPKFWQVRIRARATRLWALLDRLQNDPKKIWNKTLLRKTSADSAKYEAPTALVLRTSAMLWNVNVCMNHAGKVFIYFQCTPSTLDQYLSPLNAQQ